MSESPLEVMDVSPVFALAPSARVSVVSVVSSVASLSPLPSLEIDGSPVTQHNKADAAIRNSYRNAYTSPTQTLFISENQSNIVVNITDPPPSLPNLGFPPTQTVAGVRRSPNGDSGTELAHLAPWKESTAAIMTSMGRQPGLGLAGQPRYPWRALKH